MAPSRDPCFLYCLFLLLLQEKVITDVLLVDQPIKRFVKPEEVRPALPQQLPCCCMLVQSLRLPRVLRRCPVLHVTASCEQQGLLHVLSGLLGLLRAVQVGSLVRHLCTDDAAAITGACLSIDGGWTAR